MLTKLSSVNEFYIGDICDGKWKKAVFVQYAPLIVSCDAKGQALKTKNIICC